MSSTAQSDKKMQAKDFFYAVVFGVLYLVLMMIIVTGSSALSPVLSLITPLTVGLICGTVYVLCVVTVQKFGTALIFGALFTAATCYRSLYAILFSLAAALIAEFILFLGRYKSQTMSLLSFVFFNLNTAAPTLVMLFHYDRFMLLMEKQSGIAYTQSLAKFAFNGKVWYVVLGCAVVGGVGGAVVAKNLLKKHFSDSGASSHA